MTQQKSAFLIREGALESIIADTYTFGCIFLIFFINRYYLGDHWYIHLFGIVFALISSRGKSLMTRFDSEEDLITYLNKNYGKKTTSHSDN